MKIWHENLIPQLCKKHLQTQHRQLRDLYSIAKKDINSPHLGEFMHCPVELSYLLYVTVAIMKQKGFLPKARYPEPFDLIENPLTHSLRERKMYVSWASFQEQERLLKYKCSNCLR